jgi:gliding motility-associated-like protein
VQQSIDVNEADDCFPKTSFYIPNIFSPNGDGINEVFTIGFYADLEIESIQGSIFDRWGNLVFSSDKIPFVWNGGLNGTPLNPGVYCYRISLAYRDRNALHTEIVSGDLTLVR